MTKSIAIDHPCSPERIKEVHWWTDDLLTFRVTRPPDIHYLPGQYARIALQVGNQLIWRPFSFVSAPGDDSLEFLAVLVAGGLFTGQLKLVSRGDTIWVAHEHYGFMTPDRFEDGDILWLLATGTGIGAFVSMLRDTRIWGEYQHIVLAHGVRRPAQLVYHDELAAMQDASRVQPHRASLTLLGCLSGDPTEVSGTHSLRGYRFLPERISGALESGRLEAKAGIQLSPENSRVMMCGNPAMIDDVRKILHLRGLMPCRRQRPGQFLTENYW